MLALTALALLLAQADPYVDEIRRVNEEHAKKPGTTREADLAKRVGRPARQALERLLKAAPPPADDLVRCGEAALDLDLLEDFERVSARLDEAGRARLGAAVSRPRFIVRGFGVDAAYLAEFAAVVDAVLDGYDAVFGFNEWSKVPGKKLRWRVHLEEKIVRPPHFAPQHPFHSEVDFPVVDPKAFSSPTSDGKFLFYGLCHELGHVIAMWGDRAKEEDHHAWAHYTGLAVVDHVTKAAAAQPFMKNVRDVRWRSLEKERAAIKAKPSLDDRDGVMSALVALHDRVGPKAIAAAINDLDAEDKRLRINRVRYYTFRELRGALLKTVKEPAKRKAVEEILP
jgi:hypothetical protein